MVRKILLKNQTNEIKFKISLCQNAQGVYFVKVKNETFEKTEN